MKRIKLFLIYFLFFSLPFYLLIKIYALENVPKKIISLGPALTEEIYLLEIEEKLVGVTTYCQRPPQAQKKEKVGTATEVDLEKIIKLNPDLVLTTSLINLKTKEKLKNLGITIIDFPAPQNFSDICEQFLKLGKIVDREKETKNIVREVKIKIDFIKKSTENLSSPKVFVQIGAKPLFTVTKDSFINDFIEFAGGINIAKNQKTGLYSREEVLKQNPDIIIIATMGIIGQEEKQIWQKYKALKAAKNNQIYIIDSYKICSPTPVSFVDTLEEIVKILYLKDEK